MPVLSSFALAVVLVHCAPGVHPTTQAALIEVESGRDPLALHDNLTGTAYHPATFQEARNLAQTLIAKPGSSVDVGIAQINSRNFADIGTSAAQMLEPCANVRVSAGFLERAYTRQYFRVTGASDHERGQLALQRALRLYNANSIYGHDEYVQAVIDAAGSPSVLETAGIALSLRSSHHARSL